MHVLDDVIAAIATAPGPSGLAVVRASGPGALALADSVFRGDAPLAGAAANTLHHGWAVWPAAAGASASAGGGRGEGADGRPGADDRAGARRLDEVVAAVFRAPRSYTREDVVELSCHGGRFPAERVLAALLHAGARLARPGEFTLRAYLHGRIDLAQAEAVADLIHAETSAAHELALSQLAGALSRRLDAVSERLCDALAEVEARVDFAEDVGGIEVPPHVLEAIAAVSGELGLLLDGAAYARAVRDGVRVVLVGRPNVGKSSLFNALLGDERAIVTPDPGTTRDLVSERIEVAGIPVTLVDTAGWREGGDAAESIGVERARAAAAGSPIAVWVLDRSAPLEPGDREVAARLAGKRVLAALNKSDRGRVLAPPQIELLLDGMPRRIVEVSATTGAGLESLRAALAALLGAAERGPALAGAVANPRHVEALGRARASLARAAGAARDGAPGEIVALELREALAGLGEVTGRALGDDVLERIFARFCIGK